MRYARVRILNSKNPQIAVKLYPWFLPTQTETRMQIACELAQRLQEKPDRTLCLVAIERDIARAVLIAHVSEKYRKSVWLWQSQAELGFRYSGLMFDALKQWAKSKGAKQICMGSQEHEKAFERRWGFKRYDGEMRLRLP